MSSLKRLAIALTLLVCAAPSLAPAAVWINEFMVDNPGQPNDPNAKLDMDLNSPGWIELCNSDPAAVTLTGWALSDDPANPGKWVFAAPVAPATIPTTIPGNGCKLVFCGGIERNIANVEPHTSFKLNDGGYLLLSQPDGMGGWTVISRFGTPASGPTPAAPYPNQRKGVSYGYPANNSALAPVFFENDTPGAANGATGVTAFCKDTVFSVDRGFYDAPFTLTITSATPGATIAYTTNGNVPSPGIGTQVPAPDGLTPPTATLTITGTTILRARAWKTGLGMSNTDTQTYIFASQVLTQTGPLPSMNLTANDTYPWGTAIPSGGTSGSLRTPAGPDWAVETGSAQYPAAINRFTADDLKSMAVISLVTPWREAFGPNSTAPDFASTPVANRGFYVGMEISVPNEGTDRFASLELINPNGDKANPNARRATVNDPWINKGFQIDGNVHVFGGTSQQRWKSYKLSMRFKCQEEVGFALYGEGTAPTQDALVLDARLNQSWNHATDGTQRSRGDYVRDHVMADLQIALGGQSFRTRPVHLFINGLYWGLYLLHEKPDAKFCSDYMGGDKGDYDVFKHSAAVGVDGNPLFNQVIASGVMNSSLALGSTADAASSAFYNATVLKNYEDLLDLLGLGRVAPNPVVDMTQRASLEAAAAKMDMTNFIDYVLLNCVASNTDWPHKNYYASYKRTDPAARWRWHSWDAEHVFKAETDNTFTQGNWNGDSDTANRGPGAITRRLAQNAEFRLWFADRAHRHIFNNGPLSVAGLQAAFNRRFNEIDAWGIRGESARWGDCRSTAGQPYSYTTNSPYTTPTWTAEKSRILNTILPARGSTTAATNSAISNLRSFAGGALYPTTVAPEFRNNATDTLQHGGNVAVNFALKIYNGNAGGAGTIYYTLNGADPRTAWTGAASGTIYSGPVTLGTSTTVKARILNGGVWSALNEAFFGVGTAPASASNIVVSEIQYHPSDPTSAEILAGFDTDNDFEFVEIMNISAAPVDMTGCRFTAGIAFDFATAAYREIAPGERMVIAENPAACAMRYGASAKIVGAFALDSSLANEGERITLVAAGGAPIKDFAYDDKAPWPEAPDGDGYSLELVRPLTNPDHNLPQSWRPSGLTGGTMATASALSYAQWKTSNGVSGDTADSDNDGYSNMIEYVLGTNPASAQAVPELSVTLSPWLVGAQMDEYLTISFIRDPRTDDVAFIPEFSADMAAWAGDSLSAVRVNVWPNGDGTLTEIWRSATPFAADSRRFARIRAVLSP